MKLNDLPFDIFFNILQYLENSTTDINCHCKDNSKNLLLAINNIFYKQKLKKIGYIINPTEKAYTDNQKIHKIIKYGLGKRENWFSMSHYKSIRFIIWSLNAALKNKCFFDESFPAIGKFCHCCNNEICFCNFTWKDIIPEYPSTTSNRFMRNIKISSGSCVSNCCLRQPNINKNKLDYLNFCQIIYESVSFLFNDYRHQFYEEWGTYETVYGLPIHKKIVQIGFFW